MIRMVGLMSELDSDMGCRRIVETLGKWYAVTAVDPENMRHILDVLEKYKVPVEKRHAYTHDYALLIVSTTIMTSPLIGKPGPEDWPICLLFFPRNVDWKESGIDFFAVEGTGGDMKKIQKAIRDVEGVPTDLKVFGWDMPKKVRKFLQNALHGLQKKK